MPTNNNEKLIELKQKKADLTAQIKELEAMPKATNKPIWSILIKIIAIAVIGLFFIKPIYFIIGLGVFLAIVVIGIIDLLIANRKNKKHNQKIIALRAEETKLVSLITAENAKQR